MGRGDSKRKRNKRRRRRSTCEVDKNKSRKWLNIANNVFTSEYLITTILSPLFTYNRRNDGGNKKPFTLLCANQALLSPTNPVKAAEITTLLQIFICLHVSEYLSNYCFPLFLTKKIQ